MHATYTSISGLWCSQWLCYGDVCDPFVQEEISQHYDE